ncbi:uncharacterized protein LOC143042783 [Mytilus galloprovincialis]|uniref:uncharacterized protein LOC143042783 n=1 Tax=Mytilus galloprovincialis TaxID=29158 RepID=UPI003F7C211F
MATEEQINEQDAFACPICLETLKSPKSLPCLHTFCEACIGEFILSTEQRAEQKLSNYPCPVCRTVVTPNNPEDEASQWAALLPHNFTISSLMNNAKSVKQECHLCKRRDKISEATQWCCDCMEALCEECLQFHGIMKLSADHKIVKIEEMDTASSGVDEPDLSMISDSCPLHTSKFLEAFCFDHQQLCCLLCITLHHRKCEHVQAFEEMQNLKTDKISVLLSEVNDIKVKVENVMKEKNDEKEKLDISFTEIEAEANQFILSLKDKLDSLLAVFIKRLGITREESENAFQNKVKTFEKLSNYFEKLHCTSKTVEEHGTLSQMFIHFEKSKVELKSVLTEASSVWNTSAISKAKLVKSAKLDQVENIDGLIELDLLKTIPVEINTYVEQLLPSDSSLLSKTHPYSSFDSIILKHIKTIDLNGFKVYGGVFVSDEIVVVGGKVEESVGELKAVDILNEKIIDECSILAKVKRLAFDFESETLFVSCYGSKLYRLNFVNHFSPATNIKDDNNNNGGMCLSNGILYAIVDNTVQKRSLENVQQPLEKCFKTKTNCKNLNSLGFDSKNDRLVYTSEQFEVVCTSFNGREIFKFRDQHMKDTKSVSVHVEGIIFAADESGTIHLVSEDGERRRTVLNISDKLKCVRDICLDKSCSRLALFGTGYIKLYDVCTESE